MTSWIRTFLCAAMMVTSGVASVTAQTIRVTALEAAVRVRPDVTADVVATIKAGTVLTVIAKQDKWYEVRLPASGTTAERRGFVLADVVETLPVRDAASPAANPGQAPPSAPVGVPPTLSPDWQARRDQALAAEKSGRTRIRAGMPIALAGLATVLYVSYGSLFTDQTYDSKDWALLGGGAAMTVVGGVLTARGRSQIAAATRELLILDDEKQRARDLPAIVTIGRDGARVTVVVGAQRVATTVRVTW